jgi:hypothetical protein
LRVATARGTTLVGKLIAVDDGNLTLEERHHSTATLPRETIQGIEVSRAPGRKGHGAAIGLLIGGLAGIVTGGVVGCDASKGICLVSTGEAAATMGVLFGAIGTGIGVAVAPGERWEALRPSHVQVGVLPVKKGLSVVVRF